MLAVLSNAVYRRLLSAQIVALIGSGIATIALGLLAIELAGDKGAQVLGIALAIKMVAYITIAPIASALVNYFPRKNLLMVLDLLRAIMVFLFPLVTHIWQIYFLIFIIQASSALFTPIFQAIIPDLLKNEEDYTKALSLSRLAYDLESIVSPIIAGLLLFVLSFSHLFSLTTLGFLLSALLIFSSTIPVMPKKREESRFMELIFQGIRIYLLTPRLRGLWLLDFIAALGGAIVLVNTFYFVRHLFQLPNVYITWALAIFGLGSMLAALSLPSLVSKVKRDRTIIFIGAITVISAMVLGMMIKSYLSLLLVWFLMGIGYSMIQTPTGKVLKASSHEEDRSSLFAAYFSLSHAGWLITYPLAGMFASYFSLSTIFFIFGTLSVFSLFIANYLWRRDEPLIMEHHHDDLPLDHPHFQEVGMRRDKTHSHHYVIDNYHPCWVKAENRE